MTVQDDKTALRKLAHERRNAAHGAANPQPAISALVTLLAQFPDAIIAGYHAIRSEIDPSPALERLAESHVTCLPVTHGRDHPLSFHRWKPGDALEDAGFGTRAPRSAPVVVPDIMIVPLLAFDRTGGRLGYGAGHYDRTIAEMRKSQPLRCFGLAYAAQEFEALPQESTDQRLDAIVTEAETILLNGS